MPRQSRIADAHGADLGKGRLQSGHQLGLELAVNGVPCIRLRDVAAYIGIEQDGVYHPVAVLAKAADADVHVDAGSLVHHPEGDRAGGAVFVAHQLLGVEIIDPLVCGGLSPKGEPLAQLRKNILDAVFGQGTRQQRGLRAGLVGVFARFGAQLHHLALLHDQGALAVGHSQHRAVGDDVITAPAVGRTPGTAFFALHGDHIGGQRIAIKIFFPLVAQHTAGSSQCSFDQTHNTTLLFRRARGPQCSPPV